MAIQHNIEQGASQYGISFNNAYYRIVTAAVSRQRGTDPKFSVMIDLSAYATSSPTDDTREVDFKRYNCKLNRCGSCIRRYVYGQVLCLGYGSG